MGHFPAGGGGGSFDLAAALETFSTTLGVDVTDNSDNGIAFNELGDGGIGFADDGGGGIFNSSTGLYSMVAELGGRLAFNPAGSTHFVGLFTGTDLADLPTPGTGPPTEQPAFGLTQDGHIYFYPVGGPWALVI